MMDRSDRNLYEMLVIAHIHTAFRNKFGIPRQSGLVTETQAEIVFLPEYRNPDALRGIEGYSHLWLIWQFSQSMHTQGEHPAERDRDRSGSRAWSPTVRPPRLGGNTRMGVFATRSPNRPNAIGLSSVELERVELHTARGPVLHVRGADMLDGTPIFDIKPYLAFTDSHPDARCGFADEKKDYALRVSFPPQLAERLAPGDRDTVCALLAADPRPSYQNDPGRVYGMTYGGYEVKFTVENDLLSVVDVEALSR